MSKFIASACPLFVYSLIVLLAPALRAQHDDAPPVVIRSPDTAETFVFGSVKDRSLFWDKKNQMLVAHITFVDGPVDQGQAPEDSHDFKLPGIIFDQAKGVFIAHSSKGEAIPVAHIQKILFMHAVEALPNAVVRIQKDRGNVSVVMEAISPNDPALRQPSSDPSGTKTMTFEDLLH
jgi:hypothetical protein